MLQHHRQLTVHIKGTKDGIVNAMLGGGGNELRKLIT